MDVPSEPKVYTTKYYDFRGVDYTNDASNVWYRRSPNGLNMLPNLDGQPFKRNGWKIEFTEQDFINAIYDSYEEFDAGETYLIGDMCKRTFGEDEYLYRCKANSEQVSWDTNNWSFVEVSSVEQYKVDYFEIGGVEYLWFYTNVGCFYYADKLTYVNKSWELTTDGYAVGGQTSERPSMFRTSHIYEIGEYCYTKSNGVETFYRRKDPMSAPETTFTAGKWIVTTEDNCWKPFPPVGGNIDHGKSFFFEGGGRAAYYFFVDDKLFWFSVDDEGNEILHEAHPYMPTLLTLCDNTGTGEFYEDVNMLTELRGIEYTCDEGLLSYTVPDGFITEDGAPTGIWGVYEKGTTGVWSVIYDWHMDVDGVSIVLDRASPPHKFIGETNLKIVYRSANASIASNHVKSASKTMKVTKTTITIVDQYSYETTVVVNGKKKKVTKWRDGALTNTIEEYNTTSVTFPLTTPKKPLDIEANTKNYAGVWSGDLSTVKKSYNAYGDSVTVSGKNGGKDIYKANPSIKPTTKTTTAYSSGTKSRTKTVTKKETKSFETRIQYYSYKVTGGTQGVNRNAFIAATKSLVFGNGIINQAFLTASTETDYNTRVWYSAATNPMYFPETNYIEVGATDKRIMGLIKVGDYLGIVKQGSAKETSIYLAYPTSFEDITTYAVKQSVNGIGAISNGAFNLLNDEPLFLSAEGVMGIEPAENEDRKIRNRSYYVNKILLDEPSLESAFSFVYKGMYWLGVNNHCYVLDGSQKISWENTKTNLQYESYYLDNVPAKCFAKKNGALWFIDTMGNACRFRDDNDALQYVDAYDAEGLNDESVVTHKASGSPTIREDGTLYFSYLDVSEILTEEFESPVYTQNETAGIYTNGITFSLDDNLLEVETIVNTYTYAYYNPSDQRWHPAAVNTTLDDTQYSVSGTGFGQTVTISPNVRCFHDAATVENFSSDAITIIYKKIGETEKINVGDIIQCESTFYTVTELDTIENENADSNDTTEETFVGFVVVDGVPILARWGTIADDDGSAHYYKKLQKKGCLVALMPMSDSGVRVYIIPDEKDPIFVGETDVGTHILPFNYYLKKKVKNYKRLQIVCENDSYNDGFGVDEIIKSYSVGNYAKK